jgi:hypothetical protein
MSRAAVVHVWQVQEQTAKHAIPQLHTACMHHTCCSYCICMSWLAVEVLLNGMEIQKHCACEMREAHLYLRSTPGTL